MALLRRDPDDDVGLLDSYYCDLISLFFKDVTLKNKKKNILRIFGAGEKEIEAKYNVSTCIRCY